MCLFEQLMVVNFKVQFTYQSSFIETCSLSLVIVFLVVVFVCLLSLELFRYDGCFVHIVALLFVLIQLVDWT